MIELAIADMRSKSYLPRRIIPIGGGGIIPAAILAYRFYKKDHWPVELHPPVYAKSYTPDHKQHQLSILFPPDLEQYDSPDTLFVDDIVDTGATLHAVRAKMPESYFFSLVTKIVGQPNWYSALDRDNQWWNFPWEKVPTPEGPKLQVRS
jgi:hypoxanthine phosphoribosyltransferase